MSLRNKENWPKLIKDKWQIIHDYGEALYEFRKEKKRKMNEYEQILDKDAPNIDLDIFDMKCYELLDDLRIRNIIPLPVDCSLYKIIVKAKDIINIQDIEQKEDSLKEKSIEIKNHPEKLNIDNDENNIDYCMKMDDDLIIKWYQNGRRELAEYICKYAKIVEGVKIRGHFIGEQRGYKGEDTEFHLSPDELFEIIECNDPTIDLKDVEFDYDDYNWENLFTIPVMRDEDVECNHKSSRVYAERDSNRVCFVVLKNN